MENDLRDKDDSIDKWVCPHCGRIDTSFPINQVYLKSSWKEILVECQQCEELYIKRYKFSKIIKLKRE